MDQAMLTNFTVTHEEYKKTLIDVIDNLARHSYIAKLNIIYFSDSCGGQ